MIPRLKDLPTKWPDLKASGFVTAFIDCYHGGNTSDAENQYERLVALYRKGERPLKLRDAVEAVIATLAPVIKAKGC